MKCKHNFPILGCDPCLSKISRYLLKQDTNATCYVNAFINQPISSSTTIRTFNQNEIISSSGDCLTIPLTSVCSGSLLQIGDCKSPQNAWCKVIDQANGYITSVQVPECCDGCYTFDLSASVALTAVLNSINVVVSLSTRSIINVPVKATLRLSEQMSRDVCVADEIADTPQTCFTSVTFPIIDTASATSTLSETNIGLNIGNILVFDIANNLLALNTLSSEVPNFTNLSVSGTVCLKSCQRLVPTLTIQPLNLDTLLNTLTQNTVITSLTFTDIKLQLANLSMKLVRICGCKKECNCYTKSKP